MGNKFNARGVSEDFKQCYDFLKMFSEVHGEYHGKLDDNKQETYDFCFDEVDQKTFTFRHSVYNYLKGNEEFISRGYRSSRKTNSLCSNSNFKSRKSEKLIKKQVIIEKVKFAELEVLASFRKQQKHRSYQ